MRRPDLPAKASSVPLYVKNVCSRKNRFLKVKASKGVGHFCFSCPLMIPLITHAESPASNLQRHIGCSLLPISRASR